MKQPVAVMNNHTAEYVEQWNGQQYRIPAGKAIVMSRRDAVAFMGNYGGSDPVDPTRPKIKMLSIRPIEDVQNVIVSTYKETMPELPQIYVCHFDGHEFPSKEALDEHLKTHADLIKTGEDALSDPEGMVTCQFCGKNDLKGSKGLMSHLRLCPKLKPEGSTDDTPRTSNISEVTVS